MKRKRNGYTLIEVALFLAVTGLLFVGIIAGTGNSIASQRFFDATQNYAEFLRSVYSEVSNPQSVGNGRSEMAIYGKMISFGQRVGLDGEPIDDPQEIFVYDVVGNVVGMGTGTAVEMLKGLNVNVAVVTEWEDSRVKAMGPAGIVENYVPKWGASIETTGQKMADRNNLYEGTILIVRHPRSGTINTLVSDTVIQVNELLVNANASGNFDAVNAMLANSVLDTFGTREVDFCLNPEGTDVMGDLRRDVRLVKNARNASGVEVIDLNDYSEEGDGVRNKCMPEED